MSFCTLLTVLFICLKLCGVIAWSWWLVLLPALVDVAIVILSVFVTVFVFSRRR